MKSVNDMVGRKVCVTASGVTYEGILIEVSEDYVELQGGREWMTIPVENINSMRLHQ